MNNRQEAALAYAGNGYPVFPVVPGAKVPLTKHGFHDATLDDDQIEQWWNEHPDANIGLATKGLLVVDIDGSANEWLTPERSLKAISGDSAAWGCDMARYLARRLLFLADSHVSESEFDAKQKTAVRFVRDRGGRVSLNALTRRFQAMPKDKRQAMIENLLATGQLKKETVSTVGNNRTELYLPR